MLSPAEVIPEEIRPLRRTEYERLVALGVFDDDRVELIRGNLVTMAPNDPAHASMIEVLTTLLVRAVGDRGRVRVQLPVVACDESEPEPDLAIVSVGDYSKEHPRHVLLVIEVAVSSLKKDREVKAPLYAGSGFPEYWMVDVPGRSVEVYRSPVGDGYGDVATKRPGDVLRPEALADVEVPVATLFA